VIFRQSASREADRDNADAAILKCGYFAVVENLAAVIVSGGHGECQPVNGENLPKALLPVAGRPLLEHQLEWLKTAGIDSAILCLDSKPEQIRARFGDGSALGIKLRYCVADVPRGTAGLIKSLGAASLPDDILVLFGDIYPRTDCSRMISLHRTHQALATLALHGCGRKMPSPGVSCRGRAARCAELHGCAGEVVALGPGQRIVDFPLCAAADQPGFALSPLWIIRRGIFHFVPDNLPSDFVKDVFPAVIKAGEALVGYHESGLLADIGSPQRYALFSQELAKKR